MNPVTNQARSPLDVAVDLGVVKTGLPKIDSVEDLVRRAAAGGIKTPPQVIHGLLHVGSKMLLGGTSKSMKSWTLLEMALCVAGGTSWWGFQTTKARVLYVNFELPEWSLVRRISEIATSLSMSNTLGGDAQTNLDTWNLRGHAADIALLLPRLKEALAGRQYGLIILDPLYKLLGNRDENAAGDMADLFNQLEALAQEAGAAIVIAHHFAKGNAAAKSTMDRMSGSGVMARDPDAMVVLTPHEEPNAFVAEFVVRHFAQPDSFVVSWQHPLMRRDESLDVEAVKGAVGAPKKLSENDVLFEVGNGLILNAELVKRLVETHKVSADTAQRRVKDCLTSGKLLKENLFLRLSK